MIFFRRSVRRKIESIAGGNSCNRARLLISRQHDLNVAEIPIRTKYLAFGAFIARIYKGTRIHVEYTRVNDEIWLPKIESFRGSGRIMLVKGLRLEAESTFSNYKKFAVDSQMVVDQDGHDRE